MIERHCRAADGTVSAALWSACGRYRFSLTRRWAEGPGLVAVLLNPSTATETADDPTLRRCLARARTLGLPALTVVNLFALCTPDPAALARAADPRGPAPDSLLVDAARQAALVLCGWGNHGLLHGRGATVTGALRAAGIAPWHLGLTRRGQPRHPLYVAHRVPLTPWWPEAACPPARPANLEGGSVVSPTGFEPVTH